MFKIFSLAKPNTPIANPILMYKYCITEYRLLTWEFRANKLPLQVALKTNLKPDEVKTKALCQSACIVCRFCILD